jgi:hypothetical protein
MIGAVGFVSDALLVGFIPAGTRAERALSDPPAPA